jgi:hypothetical protein
MKCPKCQNEVEMIKFTTSGVMCRHCAQLASKPIDAAFAAEPVKVTQMEMFNSIAPHRADYFFGPSKGGMTCGPHQATEAQMQFMGKTMPIRMMKCFYMKPADKLSMVLGHFELLHADSFSCS